MQASVQEMRASVARMVAEQCELGNLIAAARPKRGGEIKKLEQHDWNGDDLSSRFFRCEMSDLDCWILLDRKSLDQFLITQPHAVSPLGSAPYLSPYLRLMLSVSAAMQVTPDNQPIKKTVEHELVKRWSGTKLSDHLVKTMATLIRDPESQRGRAKKIMPTKKTSA